MNKKIPSLTIMALLAGSGIGHADFKYTESSKITGGMMAGMMKFAGALSQDARRGNEPMESTTMVKGNHMRTEDSQGKVQIIDLEGRRIIGIDTQAKTYSIITFDQMKAALEQAQARSKQQQADAKNPNVKITPKIERSATGNSKVILEQPTKEFKVKMEMEMQTDDPKHKGQSASFWFTSDAWVAASAKGYEEVRDFHKRMAKELDWLPGAAFGGNLQMSQAMTEFRKNSDDMNGFPLLQYVSFGMGGTVPPAETRTASQAQSTSQTPTSQPSDQVAPTSPAGAIGSMLGGLGGFGRKKKKQTESGQPSDQGSAASTAAAPPPGAYTSGSMMDMIAEVTSFSTNALDSSLFEIPSGFSQVQPDADQMLGGKRR